ncbi:hypothetical protein [Actinacidiphila soli]|uniref:hypothetical protein n=1 Tax=Actinacidiphila soli TaxID=2487275 RepID=UPI000FCC8CD2|nr:hypothetical protein [Actinacidiphila soli]
MRLSGLSGPSLLARRKSPREFPGGRLTKAFTTSLVWFVESHDGTFASLFHVVEVAAKLKPDTISMSWGVGQEFTDAAYNPDVLSGHGSVTASQGRARTLTGEDGTRRRPLFVIFGLNNLDHQESRSSFPIEPRAQPRIGQDEHLISPTENGR